MDGQLGDDLLQQNQLEEHERWLELKSRRETGFLSFRKGYIYIHSKKIVLNRKIVLNSGTPNGSTLTPP